jgi:hypothetical protein
MKKLLATLALVLLAAPSWAQVVRFPACTKTATETIGSTTKVFGCPAETIGIVSYWSLDEASDGSAPVTRVDSVGSNNLTDNNTTASAAGVNGNAASFVAASNERLSRDGESFTAADYTISMWFKPVSVVDGNFHELMFLGDGWLSTIILACDLQNGNTRCFVTDDTTYANSSQAGGVSAGVWSHIVVWYDSSDKKIRHQIDGGAINASAALAGPRDNATKFTLGALVAGGGQLFDGGHDEVALYSRVLTAAERAVLFGAGAGKFWTFN